jgi:DNA-binding NtrC family response regulator
VEKAHILRTLEKVNWNRAKAAELLSIHRNTLRRKISYYGIDEGHEEGDEEGKEESVGQQSLPLNGIK